MMVDFTQEVKMTYGSALCNTTKGYHLYKEQRSMERNFSNSISDPHRSDSLGKEIKIMEESWSY